MTCISNAIQLRIVYPPKHIKLQTSYIQLVSRKPRKSKCNSKKVETVCCHWGGFRHVDASSCEMTNGHRKWRSFLFWHGVIQKSMTGTFQRLPEVHSWSVIMISCMAVPSDHTLHPVQNSKCDWERAVRLLLHHVIVFQHDRTHTETTPALDGKPWPRTYSAFEAPWWWCLSCRPCGTPCFSILVWSACSSCFWTRWRVRPIDETLFDDHLETLPRRADFTTYYGITRAVCDACDLLSHMSLIMRYTLLCNIHAINAPSIMQGETSDHIYQDFENWYHRLPTTNAKQWNPITPGASKCDAWVDVPSCLNHVIHRRCRPPFFATR